MRVGTPDGVRAAHTGDCRGERDPSHRNGHVGHVLVATTVYFRASWATVCS